MKRKQASDKKKSTSVIGKLPARQRDTGTETKRKDQWMNEWMNIQG